ncbi:MAG: alpha/beta fold hydrolase [Akkermansiaceae bacterium]|nr:alpha/beta fold hydrolase [Akkermansiaceae bacterium]MDP4848667.1 alpha/beta fold hydrolase [Akkermansiaceae bacterium]
MPLIPESTYRPPSWLRGGHWQTVHPVLFRRVEKVTTRRERLELDDGDFLDLDWSGNSADKLAVISHGLEGSSQATYVQGMAKAFIKRGWDVLAWNMRGCSGELNRLPSFYHSGKTEDLDLVIRHAQKVHPANSIDLIGFSLGGNLTLKYVGERGKDIDPMIRRAVAFSVPCELSCCSRTLEEKANRLYMERFLKTLRRKVVEKERVFPGELDVGRVEGIRTFAGFDGRFTAPLHGFRDAEDYWNRSSCRRVLADIAIPSLLVNAANDPILGADCYPEEEARSSSKFHFEIPKNGGHCGFGAGGEYWSESRAVQFLGSAQLG